MIILAIAATIVIGYVGGALGHDFMNYPELGTIFAVATMGGFILAAIKKSNKNDNA
jgi:hypothetical protein